MVTVQLLTVGITCAYDLQAAVESIGPLGLTSMAKKASVRPIECADANAHKQGGVLAVAGAAPALAEGTASIKPASKAERASAAKPKALTPWMQSKARPRPETLLQEGKHKPEPPLQGLKGRAGCMPKALPTDSTCRPEVPLQDGMRTGPRCFLRSPEQG